MSNRIEQAPTTPNFSYRFMPLMAGALAGLLAGAGLIFAAHGLLAGAPNGIGPEAMGLPICWAGAGYFWRL